MWSIVQVRVRALECAQHFAERRNRWRKSDKDEWSCALHGRILSLKQDAKHLRYRAIFPSDRDPNPLPTPPQSVSSVVHEDDTLALVKHYFNLGPNLGQLYEQWASGDANFKKKAPRFTGIRILKQDAWEALVGFICSSNNNIARISQMVEKLCTNYGPLIGHIGSQAYHDFPQPQALVDPGVEQKLRQLGFGYRAKYLHQTAVMVYERGMDWLEGLRNPESPSFGIEPKPAGELVEGGREGYRHAHEQLLDLQGVGPKVADCVCLMGLGWGEAVPVDTHGEFIWRTMSSLHLTHFIVWQIAQRDYKFGKGKHSSLTKATYDAVANRFRGLWGKEAGWAQSVLFTANLRAFSERLVAKVESTTSEVEIKGEKDAEVLVESTTESRVVAKKVKRAVDNDEHEVVAAEETTAKKSKRRRR
jgi:N-glycosylase/DNA lyase